MGSRAYKEAAGLNAISKFMEGFMAGKTRAEELKALAADRALKQRMIESQYGTNRPTMETVNMPSGAGSSIIQNDKLSLLNSNSIPMRLPKQNPTDEEKLIELGTDRYKALKEKQYASQLYDAAGNPIGINMFPSGVIPFSGMKPPASKIVNPQTASPKTQEAIEKQRIKIEQERPKATGSFNNTIREFDNMINEAKALRDDKSLSTATGLTSFTGKVPGFGPKRVASRMTTLKSKVLLNVLNSMKELSKNGSSGFGALSELEGENIKNSISSLDLGQKTEDVQAAIDRFVSEMEAKKNTLRSTFDATYGGAAQPLTKTDFSDLKKLGLIQ